MHEVDFDLARSSFLDQRIDRKPLAGGVIVNCVDNWTVFINRSHRIDLPARHLAAGPPDRWFNWIVWIKVWFGQIEL